jgi:glycosyltransferase involved in cell wall biosynthesis
MDFTIVIPARNEEAGIVSCIRSILAAAKRVAATADLVVVDDNSSDATAARAEAAGARVLRHGLPRGQLATWATGVAASEYPFVVFVDADCTVDDGAFVQLLQVLDRPGVGVVSGRAVPVDRRAYGTQGSHNVIVTGSSRFSAVLLDGIKGRLGDHDFIGVGRLMAIRREAWNVPNTALPHGDRVVTSAARRAGWRAVWVPEAKVYYHTPAFFSELRSDWQRTRVALTRSPQTFDSIPWAVQLSAACAALRGAPLDALCWVSCRTRLIGESLVRHEASGNQQPVAWD